MSKPRLLDLFSGAGGAGEGYRRAGFDVTGVDINPQPRYKPGRFIQADALEYLEAHGSEYDAIHASPPCQANSSLASVWRAVDGYSYDHVDMIPETRVLLKAVGLPFVIENGSGAPLENPIQLCGSSFGLRVQKHRLFETSWFLLAPPCQHFWQDNDKIFTVRNHGKDQPSGICYVFGRGTGKRDDWRGAMGISWMTRAELAQAIPPAYTHWLGEHMIKMLKENLNHDR